MNEPSALQAKRFYSFGVFRLSPETRVLLRDGDVVPLPPKAGETLLVLLRNPGQPVDKETLIQTVWPDDIRHTTDQLAGRQASQNHCAFANR